MMQQGPCVMRLNLMYVHHVAWLEKALAQCNNQPCQKGPHEMYDVTDTHCYTHNLLIPGPVTADD